jgi:hypothetical protein
VSTLSTPPVQHLTIRHRSSIREVDTLDTLQGGLTLLYAIPSLHPSRVHMIPLYMVSTLST